MRHSVSRQLASDLGCPRGSSEYRELSRLVRAHCGAASSRPIVVVPGRGAPRKCGEGCRFETPGGRPVYHPSAYRRAYGRPVYVASTRRVEVGAQWVARRLAKIVRAGNMARCPKIVRRMLAAA
jgi:hypothetical protein